MSRSRNLKRWVSSVLMTCSLAAFVVVGVANALAPAWLPGFPMRAGAVVLVMWLPVPGASEYKLMKKVEGAADYQVVYKGAMTNYNDADAADTTKTYLYKIVPVVGGKDGDPSPDGVLKGQEKIKPPEMGGTLVIAQGIQVRWGISPGAAFFNLYRSEDNESNYVILKSLQENQYSDRDVKPGKTYFYRVTAVDKNSLESERSAAVSAKTEVKEAAAEAKKVVHKKAVKGIEFAGEKFYEFDRPGSMAIDEKDGSFYVAEPKDIQVIDSKGEYVRRIVFPEGWSEPFGIRFTKEGKLILAFPYEGVLRIIDKADGALAATVQVDPPKDAKESKIKVRPGSPTFDDEGNLWIIDAAYGQLVSYGPDFKEKSRIGLLRDAYHGKTPFPPDAFPGLGGVSYNPFDKNLYAILSVDAQIKIVDPKTGKVSATLGGIGASVDQYSGIAGFAFRKNGNILVFDNLLGVVKEFSPKMEYLHSWGDQIKGTSQVSFSSPLSGWFNFSEAGDKFFFVSKMGNKVYGFEAAK